MNVGSRRIYRLSTRKDEDESLLLFGEMLKREKERNLSLLQPVSIDLEETVTCTNCHQEREISLRQRVIRTTMIGLRLLQQHLYFHLLRWKPMNLTWSFTRSCQSFGH